MQSLNPALQSIKVNFKGHENSGRAADLNKAEPRIWSVQNVAFLELANIEYGSQIPHKNSFLKRCCKDFIRSTEMKAQMLLVLCFITIL